MAVLNMGTDVYAEVRRAALSNWQPPGTFISESALARSFGTSRTPVREALARLAGEGFVQRIGRGYVTAPITETRIRDVARFQASLEGIAAARAAALPSRDGAVALLTLVARHAAIPDARVGDASDVEFHLQMAAIAGNGLLTEAVATSFAHLQRFIAWISGSVAFAARRANEEHRAIVQAILQADAGRARLLAERHVIEASETLVRLLLSASHDAARLGRSPRQRRTARESAPPPAARL